VVETEAINEKNIDLLLEKIMAHVEYARKSGRFIEHRKKQIRKKIYSILQYHVSDLIRAKLNHVPDLEQAVSEIYEGKNDPYTASYKLLELSSLNNNALGK
jgi:putative protein kinase ArgK-like GTPase of G3E family